jgi:hypothetical protein
MVEREWRYVAHVEVATYEAQGWVDTGESVGHHGAHSHMMYRYVEGAPVDNTRIHASAVSAERGEIVLTLVTDAGAYAYVLTGDKAGSLGSKLCRAMSDLIPSSAGRADVRTSPRNEGSNPVAD